MEPTLLALDTSTEAMALAVLSPGGRWLRNAPGGAAASAQLLPAVQALLAEAGVTLRQLDAVAFGQGPGAFTGLRTACAVAQGLAFGLGRPVLAVDSLLLVADDAWDQQPGADTDALQWVAMDARMDEVYAAAYVLCDGAWRDRVAPALYTLPALLDLWQATPPARVAGSALRAFGDRLPLGAAQRVDQERNRAAALCRLARAAWAAGRGIDPGMAQPLYLRDKVALTTVERLQQLAAAVAVAAR